MAQGSGVGEGCPELLAYAAVGFAAEKPRMVMHRPPDVASRHGAALFAQLNAGRGAAYSESVTIRGLYAAALKIPWLCAAPRNQMF